MLYTEPGFSSICSTPASWSLDCPGKYNKEDQIVFPPYNEVGYLELIKVIEPPEDHPINTPDTNLSISKSALSHVSISDGLIKHAADDSVVRLQPSRNVDYLTHDWKEEDLWSSWKFIVSNREVDDNNTRLENASWRTWTKSRNRLKTIPPESLNWFKDCDDTSLFGPFQQGSTNSLTKPSGVPGMSCNPVSKSNSFVKTKPILKKQNISEIMLRKSQLSSSLLKKQCSIALNQPHLKQPDIASRTSSSGSLSGCRPGLISATSTSGTRSRHSHQRRIRFNEEVKQCIALSVKMRDYAAESQSTFYCNEDRYDDGDIMARKNNSARNSIPLHEMATARASAHNNNNTITLLPSTALKCN